MKRVIKISLIFGLIGLIFGACSMNKEDADLIQAEGYFVSWGTVVGNQSSYHILRDDGAVLRISSSLVPFHEISDGQRIVVNYRVLSVASEASRPTYYIRLNNLFDVATKDVRASGSAGSSNEDRAPIDLNDAWFGWDYLNVIYQFKHSDTGIKHSVDLSYYVKNDILNLNLTHNKNGDGNYYTTTGYMSFDMSKIVPVNEPVSVVLTWIGSDNKTHYKETVYNRRGDNETKMRFPFPENKIPVAME